MWLARVPEGRRVGQRAAALLFGLIVLVAPAWSQRPAPEIDFNRARAIRERMLRGEAVSAEERAYLERARAAFPRKTAKNPAARGGSAGFTPSESTRLIALTDLDGRDRYKGEDGGLYGGGRNAPPEALRARGLAAAEQVRPLDAEGRPAATGKIVLLAVGMSNTTQEFQRFLTLARRDPALAPAVVLVDAAQGGMDAQAWVNPAMVAERGRPDPWTVLDARLRQAGVTRAQVQVVWMKQARANPSALGEFPDHVDALRDDLRDVVDRLGERCPNLKLIYLSSRIYAGYATTPLNPEPYAYESAYAVRKLIREQGKVKPTAKDAPAKAAPVLLWGPYLWSDGTKGRRTEPLRWSRDDFGPDGTHPSPSGQQKVAERLLTFFKTDPTTTGWFLKHP